MALMCRRKAFSVISRYRLCGRFLATSQSTTSSSPALSSSSLPQMVAWKQLQPAMEMHSSLGAPSSSSCDPTGSVPFLTTRSYTAPAFSAAFKDTINDAPCYPTPKFTSRHGCRCMAGVFTSSRSCTTTAYPPPTPPGEFQGGDEDGEADGASLNIDEAAAEEGEMPPEDFDMPPYADAEGGEDDGDYVDEEPPPDPEEALLFSPSDSD